MSEVSISSKGKGAFVGGVGAFVGSVTGAWVALSTPTPVRSLPLSWNSNDPLSPTSTCKLHSSSGGIDGALDVVEMFSSSGICSTALPPTSSLPCVIAAANKIANTKKPSRSCRHFVGRWDLVARIIGAFLSWGDSLLGLIPPVGDLSS